MKITKDKATFKPINIRLECMDDVIALRFAMRSGMEINAEPLLASNEADVSIQTVRDMRSRIISGLEDEY